MHTCLVQFCDLASRLFVLKKSIILSFPPNMTGPSPKNDIIKVKGASI